MYKHMNYFNHAVVMQQSIAAMFYQRAGLTLSCQYQQK